MATTVTDFGINLLDEEIDDVIFQTNSFLTDSTFISSHGPFWWILEMSMSLAALFAIIMAANMAYKMMVKSEPFDVLKICKVLSVAIVMCWWYPPSMTGMAGGSINWSILDGLAYIPNAIGSYTHDLYQAEASQVQDRYDAVLPLMAQLKNETDSIQGKTGSTNAALNNADLQNTATESVDAGTIKSEGVSAFTSWMKSLTSGGTIFVDKIVFFFAIVIYRVGWWSTIYCQQILLGMLTIFGPIQWAFSLLPKWEGAWSKWLIRYLTVHFYGAMLYFVGFYILLLFDITLSLQYETLKEALSSEATLYAYMNHGIMSAGYLLAASIVAVKCLNLVPDLAAWMIPEGDTAFSTRNFGEGVALQAKSSATSMMGGLMNH